MADTNIFLEATKIVISSGIATFAAYKLNNWSNRKQEEKRFKDELTKIIQISIQYPDLENEDFTNKYPSDESKKSDYLRYDSYCILIFNLLEQLAVFYFYDKNKIEKFIFIEEWVHIHRKWWEYPEGKFKNQQGYTARFIEIVNSYQ